MRLTILIPLAIAGTGAAHAQTAPPYRPGASTTDTNPVPTSLRCWDASAAAWSLCALAKQESFRLAAANTASSAATVFGGDYILSQTCTAYGTLKLQVLGPDGTTWLDLLTKTGSDAGSGTGLALGSFATVRVTVIGTTGCNVILARVPA